jgi:hypothetical protein
MKWINFFIFIIGSLIVHDVHAQSSQQQYPGILRNSFFSVNLGYIHYPFTQQNLEPGFEAGSIERPPIAARIFLFGHHFNPYLSAELSYMRPVKYLRYINVNNDKAVHTVWMHYGTLTATARVPVAKKLYVSGSGGVAVISRRGFSINGQQAIKEANYGTWVAGAGLEYKLNSKWDLLATANYFPAAESKKQPYTLYGSAGFRYNMREQAADKVNEVPTSKYHFPKNIFQVGYSTNAFGYGPNHFFARRLSIFWGGAIEIERGLTINYQRNLFHTKKVFALDVGTGIGFWRTKENKQTFVSISAYPVLRFNLLRTKPLDGYFLYSVAGPTFMSKDDLDGEDAGRAFTFQDFMGIGFFAGKNRKMNFEININHFSNGNIFTENAGVKIPMTFIAGYTF